MMNGGGVAKGRRKMGRKKRIERRKSLSFDINSFGTQTRAGLRPFTIIIERYIIIYI